MNDGKFYDKILVNTKQSNETLAKAAKQGDTDALRALFCQVRAFIRWKAARYVVRMSEQMSRSGVEFNDLMQEGYFALLDAVAAYDPERGFKFVTWLSYPLKNRWNTLLGIRGSKKMLNLAVSLDEAVTDDDDTALYDLVQDETATQALEDCEHEIYCQQLLSELQHCMNLYLTDMQREIINRQFFCGESIQKIADDLGKDSCTIYACRQRGFQAIREKAKRDLLPFYDSQAPCSRKNPSKRSWMIYESDYRKTK